MPAACCVFSYTVNAVDEKIWPDAQRRAHRGLTVLVMRQGMQNGVQRLQQAGLCPVCTAAPGMHTAYVVSG